MENFALMTPDLIWMLLTFGLDELGFDSSQEKRGFSLYKM
jgi:hypothetical protein